jgi:hypothetical protein
MVDFCILSELLQPLGQKIIAEALKGLVLFDYSQGGGGVDTINMVSKT